ncbi:hypothetical protein LUZ60_017464 [Juncus effusus]|nr:hypothetical protein LUZ60_017464 [Juncus effusus]
MASNQSVMVGVWGYPVGTLNVMDSPSVDLRNIVIKSGDIIDSIAFSYVDKATGNTITAGPWGGSGGSVNKINIDANDYLVTVNGTYGDYYGHTVIQTLTFIMHSGKQFGPFGTVQGGTPFTLPVINKKIVGFLAYTGIYVNGIGFYINP